MNPLTGNYLLPHKNADGYIINLTSWHPKSKRPMKTPGIKLSLIGLENLKDEEAPIYLVEGEWDVIALNWLLKSTGNIGVVVGVPGANMFKDTWLGYFQRRDIRVLYDNDKAGFDGQTRIAEKLRTTTDSLKFLLWPELTKTKYDVRDLIIEHGGHPSYTETKLKKTYDIIISLLSPQTQYERDNGANKPHQDKKTNVEIPTREELVTTFSKHLKIKDDIVLATMCAAIFANKMEGDPVWLFLVAPPGGSKTEYLMTLSKSPLVETTSTLTPAALIPGTRVSSSSADTSLLKLINNRNLVVKDLTTMLSMPPMVRDEIFGILRDLYDGYVEKYFATHKKSYKCKTGLLAGVTPAIDSYNAVMTTMGARAIYLRLGGTDTVEDEIEKIKAGLNNVNNENAMREEMGDVMYRFLEQDISMEMPKFPNTTEHRLISMAMFTSAVRASIMKDKYTQEQTAPAFREVGIRLAKVYKKLCFGYATYYGIKEVDERIMSNLREVCIDTCPSIVLNIIRKMYEACKNSDDGKCSLKDVQKDLQVSRSTISRNVDDLLLQGLIIKDSGMERVKGQYKLSDYLLKLIKDGNIFDLKMPKKFFFSFKGKPNS